MITILKTLVLIILACFACTYFAMQWNQQIMISESGFKGESKWKFVDLNGNVILDVPELTAARNFSNGRAAVMTDESKWGFINNKGTIVIDTIYDDVGNFSEDFAKVQYRNKKWGYIDIDGRSAFEMEFARSHDFSEGLALVETDKAVLTLNKQGKLTHLFDEGSFRLYADDGNSKFTDGMTLIYSKTNKMFGYLRRDGKMAIEPQFKRAKPFSEGVAIVSVEIGGREMATLINTRGEMLFPPRFDIDFDLLRKTANFSEGLFGISPPPTMEADSTFDYLNKQGEIVIETEFFYADSFHEGRALVWDSQTDKWGFIDKSGNVAISPRYLEASQFSEGLACVR